MSKCTSSCTNANKFEESEKARTELVNKMDSTVKVLAIPTNEELAIARETLALAK